MTPRSAASLARRWAALGAYTVALYAFLPYGPRVGRAVLRSPAGPWMLGPGLAVLGCLAAALLLRALRRRRAPLWTYAALAGTAAAYALAFSSLRGQQLERTHLPQYGVAAWLAWRAVAPLVPGTLAGYAAAAAVGAAIGYGDELLQALTPGRVYDVRDVGMNALGALLGTIVLATLRAGRPVGAPGPGPTLRAAAPPPAGTPPAPPS
jgi:hypothetical protein